MAGPIRHLSMVHVLAIMTDDVSSVPGHYGRRRELSIINCPLTSTYMNVHICIHTRARARAQVNAPPPPLPSILGNNLIWLLKYGTS